MNSKNKKRKIALILGVPTLITAAIIGGMTGGDANPKNTLLEDKNVQVIGESGIKISSLSPLRLNSDNTITKTITATVLDKDALDKSVDWEIDWSDDAPLKEEPINDYLSVMPEEDGSTTAFLTCKKSFRGSSANLKVITRVGKFEAVCLIRYEGIPSSIELNTTNLIHGENNENFVYALPITENNIEVRLDNVFGDVGDNYYEKVSITSEGIGSINVATYHVGATYTGWGGNDKTIDLNAIKDKVFSASYQNRTLTITPKMKVESYYDGYYGNSQGCSYQNKFRSYVNGSAGTSGITPYFRVQLRSGDASTTFSFQVTSAVTSVSLDQTITF